MRNIGLWLDQYDFNVARLLRAMNPGAVLVGNSVWYQIPEILADCGGDPLVMMRKIGVTLNDSPEVFADEIFETSRQFRFFKVYGHGINEPVVGTKEERLALVAWEIRFIRRCHELGVPTICMNLAWGNPGGEGEELNEAMEDLKSIHDESDLVGMHLYDVMDQDGKWIDREYSTFRYRKWPAWLDRSRLLSTEVGIDGLESIDGHRPGWQARGIPEDVIVQRMLECSRQWRADGLIAGIWFAGATQNSEWAPYYPTLSMANKFGSEADAPGIPGVLVASEGPGPVVDEPGEEILSMSKTEAWLKDMWQRAGVSTHESTCAFWKYAVKVAETEGRVIVPQPSPDGSFENHADSEYVVAYTMPALYADRSKWKVKEGLPPLS